MIRDSIEYLIKHNDAIQYLYGRVFSAVFKLLSKTVKTDEKLVLFSSFSGKKFDESPKVIFEAMKKRPDCKDLHYVWAFTDPSEFNVPGARKVKIDTPDYFMTAFKAKYWVTNVGIERNLHFKKANQVYLRTHHGTGPKTTGNAAKGRKDYDFSSIDIITSDGEFTKECFIRDFKARPESVKLWGSPGEDELWSMTDDDNRRLREQMGLSQDAFVVLYAPTWRDDSSGKGFVHKPPITIDKWRELLPGNALLLFRAHSITTNTLGVSFDDKVLDYSNWPHINDLYCVADLLISDYSGVFANYAILGKPMLCFAYDYDEYAASRGFYFDIREDITSFDNEDDLLEYISELPVEAERAKTKRYFEKIAGYGGASTEKCIDEMLRLGATR